MEQNDGRQQGRLRLISLEETMFLTGLSRSLIYDLIERGLFPRGVRVGLRVVRWFEHEVLAWIRSRPRATLENLR